MTSPLICHTTDTVAGDAANVPLTTAVVPIAVPLAITGFVSGAMATVALFEFEQPLASTTVRYSVYEPDAPAVTLTLCPVVEPGMVPLPDIDQRYELMPLGPE